MKHRGHLPEIERVARSKIAKLLHDEPFIAGSMVKMFRTCGKAYCRCAEGYKHESWYLSVRYKGVRKKIFVPRHLEEEVIRGVNTYKEIKKQIGLISEQCLERIIELGKERG